MSWQMHLMASTWRLEQTSAGVCCGIGDCHYAAGNVVSGRKAVIFKKWLKMNGDRCKKGILHNGQKMHNVPDGSAPLVQDQEFQTVPLRYVHHGRDGLPSWLFVWFDARARWKHLDSNPGFQTADSSPGVPNGWFYSTCRIAEVCRKINSGGQLKYLK